MSSLINNTIFAADPSAHVFNDRLYLYVSYDEPYTNSYDSMVGYHVLSTDDLNHWTDHGRVLHLSQVDWAISHMWAIDCNFYQGKYYLTFCAIERGTSTFRTGLAVSDRPEGPFTDLGPIEGVEWGQDPAFFIDDDGTPYLVWGARGSIMLGELNADLRSIKPETVHNISEQVGGYEGPFLHKYQGRYYLTYPALDGEKWPQRMCHAVADSPLGPYRDLGVFIGDYPGNSGTIHGSVVEFRGQWLAFYHSGWVSGTATARSLMMDQLYYNSDGTIAVINPHPSPRGYGEVDGEQWEIVLDAAAAPLAGGALHGTTVVASNPADLGKNPDGSTGAGYVTGFTQQEYGLSVLLQVGAERDWEVSVRYRSKTDRNARVLVGGFLFYDGNQNQSYDQYVNRGTVFPNTDGNWRELVIGRHRIGAGEYQVRLSHSHNLAAGEESIEVDCFIFRPLN
jgi:Glycosyl hydrolases family 43